MTERWEKTVVIGRGAEDRYTKETVLHRRGADVLSMAMRRNPVMPGCDLFVMTTVQAFTVDRAEDDGRRRNDIPRDERNREEWVWE